MKDANEKELFSSVKDVPNGSNDNTGLAILGAAGVAIVGALILAALGIKGGIVMAIPAILAIFVFKAIRNK
jgi:hypothetical protein